MKNNRRIFCKSALLTAGLATISNASMFAAPRKRSAFVGHTGITWPNKEVATAISDVGSEGFYGFETFGDVLERWEQQPGGLGAVLQAHSLPLISAYCAMNLTDVSARKAEVDKAVRWAGIVKKYSGRVAVIGPNPVDRKTYNFGQHKTVIVDSLNEICQAVTDAGVTAVLHQHAGTCVESKDETYAVLNAVNTKYVRFGPDIGQLTKGGSDATAVVRDFLPIIEHMHLKDWNGLDEHFAGYCPLGQGKVNVPAVLDLMEGRKLKGMIMVELDYDGKESFVPLKLAQASKQYLQSQGVRFRS
jgi:inosose dehydratase